MCDCKVNAEKLLNLEEGLNNIRNGEVPTWHEYFTLKNQLGVLERKTNTLEQNFEFEFRRQLTKKESFYILAIMVSIISFSVFMGMVAHRYI